MKNTKAQLLSPHTSCDVHFYDLCFWVTCYVMLVINYNSLLHERCTSPKMSGSLAVDRR